MARRLATWTPNSALGSVLLGLKDNQKTTSELRAFHRLRTGRANGVQGVLNSYYGYVEREPGSEKSVTRAGYVRKTARATYELTNKGKEALERYEKEFDLEKHRAIDPAKIVVGVWLKPRGTRRWRLTDSGKSFDTWSWRGRPIQRCSDQRVLVVKCERTNNGVKLEVQTAHEMRTELKYISNKTVNYAPAGSTVALELSGEALRMIDLCDGPTTAIASVGWAGSTCSPRVALEPMRETATCYRWSSSLNTILPKELKLDSTFPSSYSSCAVLVHSKAQIEEFCLYLCSNTRGQTAWIEKSHVKLDRARKRTKKKKNAPVV